MRYDPIDPNLFVENRARLVEKLPSGSLAILHSNDILPTSADGTFPLHQNRDLFYLSGIDQEETVLLICPGAPDPADREILFVRETSEKIAIWEGQKHSKESARESSGITAVHWLDRFEPTLRRLLKRFRTVYLNHDEHSRSTSAIATRDDRFRAHLQSLHPAHEYRRLAPLLYRLRSIKSPVEIDLLRRAIDITGKGFRRVLDFVRPGVAEYEVEAEYLHEFIRNRSRGFAYTPIIASGSNACVLHYLESDAVCQDGEILLLDVAAEYACYNADLTRSIPVNGRFTDRQRKVYHSVWRVLKACTTDLLRPGTPIKEYQAQVGALIESELIALGLLDAAEVAAQNKLAELKEEEKLYRKYFMHGTSHLLGLDVHDVGPATLTIEEGMVFTIEPGIYIRDENLGIRLEDNVLVKESGNVNLMASTPIDPDEIEELMNA